MACRYTPDSEVEKGLKDRLARPYNPNGSIHDIAGLCDPTGRVFGLMPHPEAYLFPENHPNWDRQKLDGSLPDAGLGLKIFENAVAFMMA